MKKSNSTEWIEEEVSIAEFCDKFLGINNFDTPNIYDISDKEIQILGKDLKSGKDTYENIKSIIVKEPSKEYYTDGKLKATSKHVIIENSKEIYVKDHPDFKLKKEAMKVIDFEIDKIHNYYANGRLNHNTVPGGKALPHASSVRIRLSNIGKLKNPTTKEVYGMECQAQVIKNRLGPNYRIAAFDIFYDSGVQDRASWIEYMKLHGIITGSGHGYEYKRKDGTVIEFKPAEFPGLVDNDIVLKDEIYQSICEHYIMKYRDPNSKIVDVERTSTENDDITEKAVKE
jgi:hypothetical protein